MADHRLSACHAGLLVLAVLASGCGAIRRARDHGGVPEVRAPHAHFLDQTTVAIAPGEPDRLIHETQAAANIVVAQTIERAGSALRHSTADSSRHAPWQAGYMFSVTPNFVIRQLADSSAAVSPPSFNPKGTYQLIWMRKAANSGVSTNVNDWTHVDMALLDLVFAHWSNGQAGCFYANQEFVRVNGEFQCRWLANDSSNRAINYTNGSFSTWYVRAGVGGERHWGFLGNEAASTQHVGGLVALQYHLPFMTERPQRALFGDLRLRLEGEGERHVGSAGGINLRLGGVFERALDADPSIPANRFTGEVMGTFDALFGVGPFLRYTHGQDYYNIAFTNTITVLHWGLAFRVDRRDVFRR